MNIAGHLRLWMGILLVLVFLVPVAMSSAEAKRRVFVEADWAANVFGDERFNKVAERANGAYDLLIVKPGLRDFIEKGQTTERDLHSQGVFERPQRAFAGLFNDYLETLALQLYGLFFRGAVMLEWLMFIGLFLVGAIVDGVARRRVKLSTGGFHSPVKFTWAVHTVIVIAFAPLIYLLLPLAVTPMFMPYWTMATAIPLSVAIANAVRIS